MIEKNTNPPPPLQKGGGYKKHPTQKKQTNKQTGTNLLNGPNGKRKTKQAVTCINNTFKPPLGHL